MARLNNIEELGSLRSLLTEEMLKPGRNTLKVCCGLPCSTLGSQEVVQALREEASKSDFQIDVVKTGCQGLCQKGPLVQVRPHGFLYQKLRTPSA